MIDDARAGAVARVAAGDQVRDEQRVARRQQTVQMAHARLLSCDEMEIRARRRVRIYHRIFFVVGPSKIKSAVKSEKNSRVQPVRKARRRKNNVIGALALVAGEWIGQRLKRDQRLNAGAAHDPAGAIFGVVGREPEVLGQPAEVGSGDEIQFVGAQRLIGVHQTVDAVVLEIQIAGGGVKSVARGIAQAGGEVRQVRRGYTGVVVDDGQHENGVARQRSARAGDVVIGERGGMGGGSKIVFRTHLEQ